MFNSKETRNADINAHEDGNVMNINGLRKQNLPYIVVCVIYYIWIVFFSARWMSTPITENVLSIDPRSLMYSVSLLSSGAFIFIIQKEQFAKFARIGALFLIAGMVPYLIIQDVYIKHIMAIAMGITLGCLNISILIPFVFTLNNTEKLYSVVGSNMFIYIISLIKESRLGGNLLNTGEPLLSLVIILITLSLILFIKRAGIPTNDEDTSIECPEFRKRIYLTLFFNIIVVILCKGVGRGILNLTATDEKYQLFSWYYIGGLVGSIFYMATYWYNSKPFIWLGNITFSSLVMGLFFYVFIEKYSGMAVAFSILAGISGGIGMINMFYIIGVVGRKYNSMHFLKLSILLIGVFGGISSMIISGMIQRVNTFEISMFASIISVAVMLILIMLSPLLSQLDYYNDWAKDSEMIEIDNEQLYMFAKYHLSKREIQVCKLLLQGYTLRQISGILSIAYSTVNTYCTSTYRKLGINSRTELMILFKDYAIK